MTEAFVRLTHDRRDARERARRAWHVWKGVDPDRWDAAAGHDQREEALRRWRTLGIHDALTFAFEVAGRDLGDPAALARQAWLRMNYLVPDDLIPPEKRWLRDRIASEEHGLARLMSVLDPSDAQAHAIRLAHEQFIQVYSLFCSEMYNNLAEHRDRLQQQLATSELMTGGDDPTLSLRDRMRLEAFMRSDNKVPLSAYSGELLATLLRTFVDMEAAANAAMEDGYAQFVAKIGALLTDAQAERMQAAATAYDIGRMIAAQGIDANSTIRFASVRIDARFLLDPAIPEYEGVAPEVERLRVAIADNMTRAQRDELATLIDQYEARWRQSNQALLNGLPPSDRVVELYLDLFDREGARTHEAYRRYSVQSLGETIAMQRDIDAVLVEAELPGVADLWNDVCHRGIHRNLYSRWPSIDVADDLERAAAPVDHEADVKHALHVLSNQYANERTRLERRLIDASRAVINVLLMEETTSRQRIAAFERYADEIRSVGDRCDWYLWQAGLIQGHT